MLPITSRWIPLVLTDNAKPITVWVQVVDTQDPNKFLTFIGETLEESKEKTASVLKAEVVPGEKEKLRLEEAKKNREAVQNYFTSYSTAEKKYIEYEAVKATTGITPLEVFTKALEARAAQEDANTAAILAGRNPPYNESALVNPEDHRPPRPGGN
jgi:hypothetical protein